MRSKMQPLALNAGPLDLAKGLVYLAAAQGPQTHVLIIGVGSYPWSELPELSSPAVSARTVADWFLNYPPEGGASPSYGFANPKCPLGSLAILLSEPAQGGKAQAKADRTTGKPGASYRGTPTRQPDFDTAFEVARSWGQRVSSNPGNMAAAYFCGHGLSDEGRSAFLLENYQSDAADEFAGLVAIDDFIKSAATLKCAAQLLFFDCCRNEVDTGVQSGVQLGERLLKPVGPRNPDLGQIALFGTILSREATGRTNQTSLFAASLLAALELGATRLTGKWVVKGGGLFDAVASFLALHGRSESDVQQIDGQLSGNRFDINFPNYSDVVRTFVSLPEPEDWSQAEIKLFRGDEHLPFRTVYGANTQEPFCEERLRTGEQILALAETPKGKRASDKIDASLPALFVSFGAPTGVSANVETPPVERPPGARAGAGGSGSLLEGLLRSSPDFSSIGLLLPRFNTGRGAGSSAGMPAPPLPPQGKIHIVATLAMPTIGAIATILPLSANGEHADKAIALPFDGTASVTEPPGTYQVSILFPGGQSSTATVTLEDGGNPIVRFYGGHSPREYLNAALLSGVVSAGQNQPLAIPAEQNAEREIVARVVAPPGIVAALAADPLPARLSPFRLHEDRHTPRRYALIESEEPARMLFQPTEDAPPLWMEISIGATREICALPAIGKIGDTGDETLQWQGEIVIDRHPEPGRNRTAGLVRSARYTGLTGHLARRNFDAARCVLDSLRDSGIDPLADGAAIYNPLAQVAAGLILAATSSASPEPFDAALEKLASRYPSLPDGMVVLARRRWSLANTVEDYAAVSELFRQAFDRGVPIFAPALDWLAQGLLSFDETASLGRVAAMLVRRLDSRLCFTSIRTS
jgi:Caspase domain